MHSIVLMSNDIIRGLHLVRGMTAQQPSEGGGFRLILTTARFFSRWKHMGVPVKNAAVGTLNMTMQQTVLDKIPPSLNKCECLNVNPFSHNGLSLDIYKISSLKRHEGRRNVSCTVSQLASTSSSQPWARAGASWPGWGTNLCSSLHPAAGKQGSTRRVPPRGTRTCEPLLQDRLLSSTWQVLPTFRIPGQAHPSLSPSADKHQACTPLPPAPTP